MSERSTAEVNITEVLIGVQFSGKSWYAMHRSAQLADEYDCPLIIHDAGTASINKAHNPYHHCDWKRFTTAEPPRRIFGWPDITVVNTGDADDVLVYADTIRRKGPCVVLVDEVTAARSMTPQNIGEPWRSRIAQRRAYKTALLVCMQYPTMASRFLVGTATSIKIFRVEHELDLKALKNLRFSDAEINTVKTLRQGEFIERNQGFAT